MAENTEIEKPWAVYSFGMGSSGIGKVIKEDWLEILYSEDQKFFPQIWDSDYVQRFDSPIKAMAYFLVHQNPLLERLYTKRQVIDIFLRDFPSQRKDLSKYLQPLLRTQD